MPWVQSAGPSTEDSGPAPAMIGWLRRNQATSSPMRASMASMNHGLPWAARTLRGGNRVGSTLSLAFSANPGISIARSRDSVTRTVAQGCSSLSGHSVLSTTLTRPPSVKTASCVRSFAIGVGYQRIDDGGLASCLDANSGTVLHSTNPDAQRHPASLTKIMTLYLLFEQLEAGKLKLDSQLKVSAEAAGHLFMTLQEQLPREDMDEPVQADQQR